MARRGVGCHHTLSRPWTHLPGPRLQDASVVLRPCGSPMVVPQTGGVPLRARSQPRQDRRAPELGRWPCHPGMPPVPQPKHAPPADRRPAGRMVMAARARGPDAQALPHAILTALRVETPDRELPAVRAAIGASLRPPGAAPAAEAESPAIRAEWDRDTAAVVTRGGFGSAARLGGDLWRWAQDRPCCPKKPLAGAAVQTP